MYDQVKAYLINVYGSVDARVVQEIVGYFESLEVIHPSTDLMAEAETLYNYLSSGRTIFGGQR